MPPPVLVNVLRPHDHVTPTLKLHWLPIAQCIEHKLCLLVHKTTVCHAPINLTDQLTAVTDVPSRSALRDASNGNRVSRCVDASVLPRTRLKLGEKAISVAAPRAWNRLPTDLKRSTLVFKRALKHLCFAPRTTTDSEDRAVVTM